MLTHGDWTALAATAKLDPKESGDLYGLLADADNVAKFIDGDAANTGFLRALRRAGYALSETYETQIKLEDEANAKAKKQAEEEAKKKEEEAKLQSMLMPEEEQTGDWTYYNDGIRGSTYKDPVYEGESVSLSDSVPVQRQLKETFTDDDATDRLTAPATVTATVYSKTAASGKERHIYVSKDAPADPIATEPKRIQSWLNMRPEQGLWRKGHSPIDALLAALRFMSGNKAAPASFELIFLTEKGLSRNAVVPFKKLVKPLQNAGEYKKGIETDDTVWKAMGLSDLYAGLCQSLVSLYQRVGRGDSIETSVPGGSSAADNISTFDPIVLETADSFVVIGADTSIGQPYSGTVLISKDQARKEGMLPDPAPADVQQEQAQPAEPTAGSAVQVSDEAREQIRYYVKQGKPIPDGVKDAYGLTDDIINTVVNEEGLNGTEYQEGQAGTDGTDNADSRQESGESTSPAGSEDSGSAGRTGEAAESTGDVGPGAQSTGTPESPASPAGEVSAAEQGDGESSVLSNAAPASQTAGTSTGVAPAEGGERKESPSDEADAGESAEPADGSKPSVDSGNGEAQLQQTNEELAKAALAEKALRNYIGDTRQNLEHMISKALHGIPNSTYKDTVLNKVLPILIRFVDTVYDKFDMVVRFTDDAHYDPHAFQGHGEIQIPLATALQFVLKNTVYKNVMADTAGTTEFKFGQKERYYADRLIDMYLPAILNALLWHEASHMLLDKVYHFGGSLKSYCDKLVDTFIDITGMKIPNDGNPVYRDEIFAIGMEMAIHYMDTIGETDSPVLKILADIASRSHLNGTYATKLVAALYSSHITSFIGSPDLRVNPEKGNKDPGLKVWESAIRNNWQKIYQSEARPKAVVKYAKLIDLMTGGIPAGNNALTYAIAVMTGMASDRSTISEVLAYPRHIANYYSDVINSEDVRTFFGEKVDPVSHVHKRLARIFGITSDELTQLIPDIDTHIQDDIAILQLEFQARSQAKTAHFPYNSFEAMNTWLESSLLSSSEADTGAEAQSETPKPQQDNAANGQPKMKTPAQQANAAVEETKTKGEQEKLKETANTLANVNSKLEDKTPEQQAAEKRASDLTTQAVSEIKKGETEQNADNLITAGVAAANANANENGASLNLSLTSPYIQEITAEDMKTEDEADSNDTDSGVRYYASEADDMTEDEAQRTVDESTSSEPDPETPENKSEALDEQLDDDSGQTQQTAQDDEDSSEPAEPETGTTIDPDVPETNGRLDVTFSEVLDQYFTPDEQKQMAPDLAKVVAKLDRVVKTYGVYRRAFMEQMRNAFDASRIFRENKYVRNYMNHFIDNWDRSTASLETWAIETYQGKVAPEDNPIVQSVLLARRIGSSFTEAVNDILQRGMTMNENGDRVRMLDEKGQPVESVLEATTRMYKKLRDLGLRRDVLDTKENFRKDIGMFRTLLHTIERNEFKYEELKQQYAKLTNDYNTAMQGDDEAKAAAGAILTERAKVEKDIRHFEKMMRAESFDNISMDAGYTLPMGGRTIAMARKELDSLYKKYDAALSDAGVKDASERHAIIQEMVVSFNIAYQHAIEEMDLLSARSGFFSEHTILQRHNFKYYTPLRQDIGDGRGSTIQAAKGSTTPAIDAISNYCMEAIRRTGAVTRNVIGMALNDAYENLYADYESTHRNANATPEEKMRVISHQSIGRGISVNGLLRLRKDEWSRIPADDERFARFKQQAIFVELVRPTTAEERAAGLMDDTQLERMWIGFDPDIIGRARKSAPGNLKVSQQTATLHGIQNDIGADPDKPGYILYPEVEPRDYSDVGKALVDIAYEPNAKMGNFLKTCGFLTRTASEAMTTFNPLFALKSAISDFRERVTRLGRKEFVDSNGKKVSGVRIAIRMWRNMLNPKLLGTVGKYSIELAAHKETKNDTQYRKYLAEMHKLGIIGGVQQQMVATGGSRRSLFGMNATEKIQREIEKQRELQEQQTNKEAETLVAKLYRVLGDLTHDVSRTRIGKFLHAVHNGAIGWSNMFYNVPLAAQYIAMRECGLSERAAAADTAKAMDFTNRGYYHKVGGKFISFLTSITHGTANMMDSYGINRNSISSNPYLKQTGYARRMNMQSYAFKAARLSAYIGLVQVLMYAVGACLRPDEPDKRKAGQQLIDNMPLRNMYFLPVPILQWLGVSDPEGFVFKLAGGFGEDRLALNLAWGLDRYSRGKATMSEIAGSYMVNFVTNAAPADLPDFSPANNPARYMAYSAGHSIPMVAWLVDAALNITYSGKTLSSEFSPAMGQRAYEEHNAYIDIAYKDLSKTLYDTLGMNISPSTLKSMYEGIGYGPVVQGLMQLALHINDEVPRSRLDPDWAAANVNAIAKFFGATSLGNKMPDKPYVFIKQLRGYYEDLFRAAGVSSLLKANGSGTKAAAIQQTMRMMGMTPAEIADRVNMHDLDNKLTGILKQENALIDLRRSDGISVDQFVKRMNVLIRQANKLQSDFMKSSYYYRGIYGKRAGIPEKYRARLERENRLDAIRRANAIVDKESK